MIILIGFLSDHLLLTLIILIILMPFAVLIVRKLIHFAKLLGFYPRVKHHPSLIRIDKSANEISEYLLETARCQLVRQKSKSWLIDHLHWQVYMGLQTLRRRLSKAPAEIISLVPASQWFFDNYNLFYKELMKLQAFGNLRKYRRMPMLIGDYGHDYLRIYMMAREIVSCSNFRLRENNVLEMLKKYQSVCPILAKELWALPDMLIFCLLEKIVDESKQVVRIIETKRLADRMVKKITPKLNQDAKTIAAAMKRECGIECLKDNIFISHVVYKLRGMSINEADFAVWLAQALHTEPGEYLELLPEIMSQEEQFEAGAEATISSLVASLKTISDINWDEELQQVSSLNLLLSEDPAGIFPKMDSQSRSIYRVKVEKLARRFHYDENDVARQVLQLAKSPPPGSDFSVPDHIGTYLTGRGYSCLIARLSGRKLPARPGRKLCRNCHVAIYYSGIALFTFGLILGALLLVNSKVQAGIGLEAVLGLLMLFPAISIGIHLMQDISARMVLPQAQLAMDFHKHIPDEYRTIVVMPVIFGSESQVRTYVKRLEKHYLANDQDNLYFALLGDFKDAATETTAGDDALITTAESAINALNASYPGIHPRFSLFYRARRWNAAENCWMGWERKRGKLEEFNALLNGEKDTNYIIQVGDPALLSKFKYVITLDADTELVRESAATLVGIMAHPLNHPHIEPKTKKIIDGYAIVQPEIRSRIASPTASIFSRFFSGQTGIDPYATVVSDVYQDVFREGIFVGKGIYDIQTMHLLLHGTIPENSILSHDLLEGSLSRCAFASGVKLMDTPPAGIISYTRREHRWIRGDWQLLPWLLPRTSINWLSRWKIVDNLRRSLIQPVILALILFNTVCFPQIPWIWIPLICFDTFYGIFSILVRIIIQKNRNPSMRLAISAFWGNLVVLVLQLIIVMTLVPYRAYQAIDAILRTLYRLLISHRKLLEWQTAEAVEHGVKNTLAFHVRCMWPAVLPAILLVWGIMQNDLSAWAILQIAVALLWLFSPALSWAASLQLRPGLPKGIRLEQVRRLRLLARRTWNFFEDFSTPANNWLCPDNYQKYPGPKHSDKTSPTNIGLQLLSTLAARDMGYLGLLAFVDKCEQILATVQKLPRWHGHLYNWYHIGTLQILEPQYISTVDSGNFCAHLIALKNGLAAIRGKSVFPESCITGLRDTLTTAGLDPAQISGQYQTIGEWMDDLHDLQKSVANAPTDDQWKVRITLLCQNLMADAGLSESCAAWQRQKSLSQLAENVIDGNNQAYSLLIRINEMIAAINQIVRETDFRLLYDHKHRLFLIGYHVSSQTPDSGRYDLMASEARLTSFLAIAKGDVPQKHWFSLARPFTLIRGTPALLSWSGSMFEYLMPNLVLKTPPGSIFSQSCQAAVTRQIIQGRKQKIPWGISESQYYAFDMNSNYQYTSFGVMRLRLQSTLRPAQVVAPYATLLALTVKPWQALKNIDRLRSIGAEGEYGFYEALDYTRPDSSNLRPFSLVQCSMAHHLGMSFVAIDNLINANIMQTRFHQEPMVQATEILLEEKGAVGLIAVNRRWYTISINQAEVVQETAESRYYLDVDPPEPAAHILSNKQYMLMLTSDGEGFSSCDDVMLNRWRPDSLNNSYGSFIYIRNLDDGQIWSSAFRPTRKEPDHYQAIFSPDKVEYIRKDGTIGTHTEITLSPLDNLEVRRIILTNNGDKAVNLEATSYMEVVADDYRAEVAHPAFSKLFIETEYLAAPKMLIASRRQRSPNDSQRFVMHMVRSEADFKKDVEFEIDRRVFIGRNGSLSSPQIFDTQLPLSNKSGFSVDPILSIRASISIPAGHSASIVFITGYGTTRDEMIRMQNNYDKVHDADDLFKLSLTSSKLKMKYLSIQPSQVNAIQNLVGAIYYPSLSYRGPVESIQRNDRGQSGLWRFGISGDNPIMLLRVGDLKNIGLINEVLLAFEFLRTCHVQIDLVIFNDEISGYTMELNQLIQQLTSRLKIFSEGVAKPSLFNVNRFQLTQDEIDLLLTTARLYFTPQTGIYIRHKQPRPSAIETKPAGTPEKGVIRLSSGKISNHIPNIGDFADWWQNLEFFNGLGGFDQDGKEYNILIQNGMKTPAPWINVIANEQFGFLVSEAGAGYTWAGNSRENKLTTWSNDPVLDPVSEAIYIRDDVSGAITSPCLLISGFGGDYRVRHGFGYSAFEHEELGLKQVLTVFAAVSDPVKLWQLALTNPGQIPAKYTVTVYVEWLLGVIRDQTAPYVVTDFDSQNEYFYAWNSYNDLYRNFVAFLFASEKITSYTGNRKEFLGSGGSSRYPHGLTLPNLSGTVGAGLDPCGAIQLQVALEPGETKTVVFGLGQTDTQDNAVKLIDHYRTASAAQTELAAVRQYWDRQLGGIKIRTPDRSLDILANGWLKYQALSCRIKARAAFYQCGGAFGFRDQLQDALAFLDSDTDLVRRQILMSCAHQFAEGDVQHWWHPPTGVGVRTKISDDLLWLPYVTAEYIQWTGDYAVLQESAPFLSGEALPSDQHEMMFTPQISDHQDTVYKHCLLAIEHACRFGRNGLPLMGGGDWNDGMNAVGIHGTGESVWLGWFLYDVLHRFAPICRSQKDLASQRHLSSIAANLIGNLETKAWDGQWYLRAFFDNGNPMGSNKNEECQIDSISQSWSVLSGAADKKRAASALNSAHKYLVRESTRTILLLTPPFNRSSDNPGYIRGYYPGVRENGGQYTHAAIWLAMAFARMRKDVEAYSLLNLLNPIRSSANLQSAYRYEKEPYVMSADICMAEPYQGRAGWSWYTGSAGWMQQAIIRSFLGISRQGSDLVLDPCVPSTFNEYQVFYRYGSSMYEITFKKQSSAGCDILTLVVDGKTIEGNHLRLVDDEKTHVVIACLTENKN